MDPISWDRARDLATECVQPLPTVVAPLIEAAAGAVLAEPLRAITDLPAFDVAATDGWALAGPGPWQVRGSRRRDLLASHHYHDSAGDVPLQDGEAAPVNSGDPVGSDVTAVAAASRCRVHDDRLSLLDPDGTSNTKITLGSGIRSRAADAFAGQELLPAGTVLTPAAVALAALAGHDELEVIPPPPVLVVRVGDELVDFGSARNGLGRDAVAPALPGWLAALGAQCHPSKWVRQGDAELIDQMEDSTAAAIITAGPFSGTAVRRVLAGMDAEIVVDGVSCRPGGSMLLALLPDGRPLVHCGSGTPADALAAVVTLIAPLVEGLSGRPSTPVERRLDQTVRGSRDTTWLIPVAATAPDSPGVEPVLPGGPGGMAAWTRASHVAVIPPGGITRHRRVTLLPVPRTLH